ncbi:MAG: 23S rRNA (guanosine(2251)-2'-O)-methyltransferase RlmB [Bacteroidia bacterium]|nr:MAG: 23S rRNA (guanosine(2251)-2'-O)-methyltransferase RlmB [Bacteroidia bacterium]
MKNQDFIYGIHSVMEAVKAGKEFEKIFFDKTQNKSAIKEIFNLVRSKNILYQFVPTAKLNRITGKNHQGVVAIVSQIEYQNIENLIPMLYEEGKIPFFLVLDGITDVRNFGGMARTAECAGVDAIIIPQKGSVLVNADAVKTSAGALNRIPVCRVKNLLKTMELIKNSGIKIVAATEKTENYYYSVDFNLPLAIVMGAEDKGISKEILKIADDYAKIPLLGKIDSLNVSAACAILIYEAVKQRIGNK